MACLALSVTNTSAQYTYTAAGTSDTWSAGTNWSGTPVSATTSTLTFTTSTLTPAGTTTTTDNITGNFEANSITLGGVTASGGAGAGSAVTIDINSTSPSTGIELISNGTLTPVVTLSATKGGGGGNLTYVINAPLILENNTLFVGSGNATGAFDIASALTGPGNLTKSSTGILTLTVDNTGYTSGVILAGLAGGAVIENGTAVGLKSTISAATGNPFGQGSISTNGASILTLTPGVSGTGSYTAVNTASGTQFNYGGATQLDLNLSTTTTSLSLTLGNSGASGNSAGLGSVLNRVGDGVLILSGQNTSAVNELGAGAAGNTGIVNLFVTGTTPTLNSTNSSVNNSIILNDNGSADSGDFVTYGSNGFASDSGHYSTVTASSFTSTNAEIANINAAAVTMTDGGTNLHAAALRINSGDTLTLNGTVTIGDGTNPAGVIINASSASANTTITGGTLNFGGSEGIIYQFGATATEDHMINSAITGTNGLTLVNDSNGTTQMTIGLASTISTGNVNFDMGDINIDSGANLSADIASVSSGAVVIQTETTGTVAGFNDPTVGNGGLYSLDAATTVDIGGSGTYSASLSFNTVTSGTGTIAMTGSGTQTLSGAITGAGGTTAVAVPAGTLILTGASNTYTKGTYVSGGTLLLNNPSGSATGTGTVTVSNGGTLGGSGFFHPTFSTANTVSFAASTTLAPGTSGSTNTLTLVSSGSTAGFVGLASAGVNLNFNLNTGLTSSALAITSSFASEISGLNSNDTFNFTDLSGGNLTPGNYTLITTDDTTGVSPFGTVTTGSLTSAAITGLTGDTEQLQIIGGSGTDYALVLDLETVAVPEPGTWAMMLGGLGLLLFWQRQRARAGRR